MLKRNAWDYIETVLGWPIEILCWTAMCIAVVVDFVLGGWLSILPGKRGGMYVEPS